MIHIDCVQGSTLWFESRSGIPTASCFDKILTPGTLKLSKQAESYMHLLLAEKLTGQVFEQITTLYMAQGVESEEKAAQYYEVTQGIEVQECGLCLTDDRRIGASPDRFVGEDGLLEIKCPLPSTHVGYLLGGKIPREYVLQVQGQLYVTGRQWCDFLSYCPGLPELRIRAEPDVPHQVAIHVALTAFLSSFDTAWETLCALAGRTP